jgi:hypothetical protein
MPSQSKRFLLRLAESKKKGDRNPSIHGDRTRNDRGTGPNKTGDRS